MYINIETNRLYLRALNLNDVEFIHQLVNSPGWLRFIGDRKVNSRVDAVKYIRNIVADKTTFYSVFEMKETGQAIGVVTFIYRETRDFPDIGFAILPEFEGRGLAYEACRAYLDEIVNEKFLPKILAVTLPENKRSIRLLEKLGLNFEKNLSENGQILKLYSFTI